MNAIKFRLINSILFSPANPFLGMSNNHHPVPPPTEAMSPQDRLKDAKQRLASFGNPPSPAGPDAIDDDAVSGDAAKPSLISKTLNAVKNNLLNHRKAWLIGIGSAVALLAVRSSKLRAIALAAAARFAVDKLTKGVPWLGEDLAKAVSKATATVVTRASKDDSTAAHADADADAANSEKRTSPKRKDRSEARRRRPRPRHPDGRFKKVNKS